MWDNQVDAMLRGKGRFAPEAAGVPWRMLLLTIGVAGALYGAVMGSFGLRPLQALYSASKVPLLLGISSVVCLPSFFVLHTVLGLREDFSSALRAVVAAQATIAVVLLSIAPVTGSMYLALHYSEAILLNGAVFLVAALAGQTSLSRHYRVLIARNPRHRVTRAAWLLLYVFVAIQLAWVLRPFVGSPWMPVRYFREEAWGNAYEVVFGMIARFLFGDAAGT